MANVKISNLPSSSVTTKLDYLVKNVSGETNTEKVQLFEVAGLTNGTGSNSLESASWLTDTAANAANAGSIAIGEGASTSHDNAVSMGTNIASSYSDTMHAANYHTGGQYTCGYTKFTGSGFLNFVCSLGNIQEIEINGNTDFGFSNLRQGAVYDFIIYSNGGPYTISNWNAPGGYTLYWKYVPPGGSIPQPTANARDIYRFVVTDSFILGEQIANFQ